MRRCKICVITLKTDTYYDGHLKEIGYSFKIKNPPSQYYEIHNHDFYEYFFITSGTIGHIIDGKKEVLNQGSLVFIRPHDCHGFYQVSGEDFEVINVTIAVSELKRLEEHIGRNMDELIKLDNPNPSIKLSESTFQSMIDAHNFLYFHPINPGMDGELQHRMRFLFMRVCELFLYFGIHEDDSTKKWLEKSMATMNSPKNIEEGLPALLNITGFSHGHLCRLMDKYFNITPNAYIIELRLNHAANLLRYSQMSVNEISEKVGYTSKSHFMKIFKEKYGHTPLQYRKSIENEHLIY